jgi:hypothetical protein
MDNYFNEKSVPDIVIGLVPRLNQQIINEIKTMKLKNRNLRIDNKFQAIYEETKIFFDCKMINNGSLEDCDRITQPNVELINLKLSGTKELHYMLEEKIKLSNESLIDNLKTYFIMIFVKFSQINSKDLRLKDEFKRNIPPLNRNFWKQTPVIQISTNFNEINKYGIQLALNKKYFKNIDIETIFQNRNENYYFTKKSFEFLKTPYNSRCSYYERNDRIFNSLLQEHCIRRCFRSYCETEMNCSCFINKLQNKIIEFYSQLDNGFDNICSKDINFMSTFYNNYTKLCTHFCPIDCINDEYIIVNKLKSNKIDFEQKFWKESKFFWDNSRPFILNKGTPVLTFIDYFCYIGGLFGMWFGINANQLLKKFKENYFIYFNTLIDFFMKLI